MNNELSKYYLHFECIERFVLRAGGAVHRSYYEVVLGIECLARAMKLDVGVHCNIIGVGGKGMCVCDVWSDTYCDLMCKLTCVLV